MLRNHFVIVPYRLHFTAVEPIRFPAGTAGNTFRGALGLALRGSCLYQQIFAPSGETGPSGLRDRPRPFVLRAHALDGCSFGAGETFTLDLHLFHGAPELLTELVDALRKAGVGRIARARLELTKVEALRPWTVSLEPDTTPVHHLTVSFITPTELKTAGHIAQEQEVTFAVLFRRLRDRLSALSRFYGPGPLEADFAGLGVRAAHVTKCDGSLQWISSERRSSRTGQRHSLSGWVGTSRYQGDLAEFLPWLQAGCWTGVGRHTVWGQGAFTLTWSA